MGAAGVCTGGGGGGGVGGVTGAAVGAGVVVSLDSGVLSLMGEKPVLIESWGRGGIDTAGSPIDGVTGGGGGAGFGSSFTSVGGGLSATSIAF